MSLYCYLPIFMTELAMHNVLMLQQCITLYLFELSYSEYNFSKMDITASVLIAYSSSASVSSASHFSFLSRTNGTSNQRSNGTSIHLTIFSLYYKILFFTSSFEQYFHHHWFRRWLCIPRLSDFNGSFFQSPMNTRKRSRRRWTHSKSVIKRNSSIIVNYHYCQISYSDGSHKP